MRILVVHSRYRSGPLSGENRVVSEEVELLQSAGHDVSVVAPSPDDLSAPSLALRTLGSKDIAGELRSRVRNEGIGVVHCHNLFPTIGPGVLQATAAAGAGVVLTLHNFRLMCLAGTFFRDGQICEDCLGRGLWSGIAHRCYRGSLLESSLVGASLVTARMRKTFGSVHRFLAVSEFVRERHVRAGLPAKRMVVKPNFVPAQAPRVGPGKNFLILSRLSIEKGVVELVKAWDPELGDLVVAGDGPEHPAVEREAEGRGVKMIGAVPPKDIPALLARARALLVPSICYEGQPRAILEAFAAGVPVIASRIGGLPEVVVEGVSGLTVAPGDSEGWRMAVARLRDDEVSARLGAGAHSQWAERYSPDRALAQLEAAYGEALEERNRSASRVQ